MSTVEERRKVVKLGVKLYGEAEQALEAARVALQGLEGVYRDAHRTKICTGAEAVATIAKVHVFAGQVAAIESLVYELHKRGTKLAQDAGADSETSGGFVILGGGDR